MAVPPKLYITGGDKITPGEIEYSYKLMWENYQKDFDYAKGIQFAECCDAILSLLESMQEKY